MFTDITNCQIKEGHLEQSKMLLFTNFIQIEFQLIFYMYINKNSKCYLKFLIKFSLIYVKILVKIL